MKNERLAELLSELSTSADPVELFYKGKFCYFFIIFFILRWYCTNNCRRNAR